MIVSVVIAKGLEIKIAACEIETVHNAFKENESVVPVKVHPTERIRRIRVIGQIGVVDVLPVHCKAVHSVIADTFLFSGGKVSSPQSVATGAAC